MSTLRIPLPRIAWLMLASLLVLSGCGGPRYGASPHKKRGCDCPKWNALPKANPHEYRVDRNGPHHDLAQFRDAAHH